MNGRVDILGNNPVDRFLLYEKPKAYKATKYANALVGNFQTTILSNTFFSAENVQILQNAIIAGVYKKSNKKYRIGNQDEDVLKTIMRAMYLQFSKNLDYNIKEQIVELNNHVTKYAIPQIYNEVVGYMKYKQDVSKLSTPIDLPISSYHSNSLELKPFF
tara:strand:- start:3511 stop:3990 length:480 start_codon:yes stop_codon:yes gene_type:complete